MTAVVFLILFVDRRWPVRMLLRATGSPGLATVEWGVIAVDQAVHLCILALLAVLLADPKLGLHPIPGYRVTVAASRPSRSGVGAREDRDDLGAG